MLNRTFSMLLLIAINFIIINDSFAQFDDLVKGEYYLNYTDTLYYDEIFNNVHRTISQMGEVKSLEKQIELAGIFESIGELDKAINLLYKALDNAEREGVVTKKLDILNKIGEIYRMQGLFTKALQKHQEAINFAEEENIIKALKESQYYIGIVYKEAGDFEKAFNKYYESLGWFREQNDKEKIASILNSIANSYRAFGDNKEALKLYGESLSLFREIKDTIHIAMVLNNMGITYKNIKDYTRAMECYYKGLDLDIKNQELLRISRKLNNIGVLNVEIGNYEEAHKYLSISLMIKERMNSIADIALTNYHFGICYLNCRDYDKALEYLLKSYYVSKKLGNLNLTYMVADKLAQLYYNNNNFQVAYNYRVIANEHKDSLFNFSKVVEIGKIINKYEDIEDINDQYFKKIIIQPLTLITILIILITIGVLLLIISRQREKLFYSLHKKEDIRLEKEQHEKILERSKRKLQSTSLKLYSKEELLKNLRSRLEELLSDIDDKKRASLQEIINELVLSEKDEQLDNEIEILNNDRSNFLKKLDEKYPTLTPTEKKICLLLKLNLSTKEISRFTQQSIQSIFMSRSRIRKKLGIKKEVNLVNFLMKL